MFLVGSATDHSVLCLQSTHTKQHSVLTYSLVMEQLNMSNKFIDKSNCKCTTSHRPEHLQFEFTSVGEILPEIRD